MREYCRVLGIFSSGPGPHPLCCLLYTSAAAATWLWNAALAAKPVVLVAAAVGGLVAGVVVLTNAFNSNTEAQEGDVYKRQNIVQAGAEQLDENDFNLLKGIALSPLVQVYNYQIGVWQRVLVDDTCLLYTSPPLSGGTTTDGE